MIMLLRSNNDTGPDVLTTALFELVGVFLAIILMTLEATPSDQTPGQPSADWVQSYGERNKDCLEWTDTCVNCVRVNWVRTLAARTSESPASPKK